MRDEKENNIATKAAWSCVASGFSLDVFFCSVSSSSATLGTLDLDLALCCSPVRTSERSPTLHLVSYAVACSSTWQMNCHATKAEMFRMNVAFFPGCVLL